VAKPAHASGPRSARRGELRRVAFHPLYHKELTDLWLAIRCGVNDVPHEISLPLPAPTVDADDTVQPADNMTVRNTASDSYRSFTEDRASARRFSVPSITVRCGDWPEGEKLRTARPAAQPRRLRVCHRPRRPVLPEVWVIRICSRNREGPVRRSHRGGAGRFSCAAVAHKHPLPSPYP